MLLHCVMLQFSLAFQVGAWALYAAAVLGAWCLVHKIHLHVHGILRPLWKKHCWQGLAQSYSGDMLLLSSHCLVSFIFDSCPTSLDPTGPCQYVVRGNSTRMRFVGRLDQECAPVHVGYRQLAWSELL